MNGESGIIRVFVVAASPMARAGLEFVLLQPPADGKIIVAGSAPEISGAPFVFSAVQTIDVLLVSVEREKDFIRLSDFLSEGGGEEDNSTLPFVVALLATEFQNARQTLELLRGGVRGILPSDAERDEIAAAIAAAANNLIAVQPELLEAVLSARESEDFLPNEENAFSGDEPAEHLTTREREVLEMLAEGASNKRIADLLGISEHTVKFHVASVFGKLGVNSRTEAVTQAIRRGLILL